MNNYTTQKLDIEARHLLLEGAKQVYDLVSTTLGARGRNVVINKGFDVEVLHDGVKVSRYVSPQDKYLKAGADILREAAERHVANVGDGTTLTTVLGYHIAKEAMTLIDSGVNAMGLKKGLEKGRDIIVAEIEKLSTPVTTKEQKIQVATISSQDEELGKMIGTTYDEVGLDGVIVCDDSKTGETYLEHEEGISISKGWASPYFITDPKNMSATIRDSYILITDRELDDIYEFLDFVEKVLKPKDIRTLTIIASRVSGTLLASMIETKKRGMMKILAVNAPAFGQYKKELLEDIATMTGGKLVSEDDHKRLGDMEFEDLGYAKRITSTRETTTILENKGDEKAIQDRIDMVKHQITDPSFDGTEFDREKLKERLSKMTGGVYVIRTGGSTEIEMNEKKERVEDAILATRSAIESGIVPGGEVTFLEVLSALKSTSEEEEYAFRILKKALVKPFEKLLDNAGLDCGYYRAKLEDKEFGWGVDVTTAEVKSLIESGIIDPTAVLTEGLKSAVSVATLLLTSGAVSVIETEEISGKN